MWKWLKQRKLRKLSNDVKLRIYSSNIFLENFDFYLKQHLAKTDAKLFNENKENIRLAYFYEHLGEIAKRALIDAILESARIVTK